MAQQALVLAMLPAQKQQYTLLDINLAMQSKPCFLLVRLQCQWICLDMKEDEKLMLQKVLRGDKEGQVEIAETRLTWGLIFHVCRRCSWKDL